jgi:geranylgeranyl pyrophosphate synthase
MVAFGFAPSDPETLLAALREHAPQSARAEPRLAAVLEQAVSTPGKLVRPRLVHAAARRHGLDDGRALMLACATEYFHLASLILDDLPCMDDAAVRRGRPCVHRLHGEAPAILGALALINRAYALAGESLADEPAPVRTAATALLDACLGVTGMVGGQAGDLAFAASDHSPREIMRIAAAKTGALFSLAVHLPALVARPDPGETRLLRALCLAWGLAFQARNDLDDARSAGPEAGRDQTLDRPNLVHALGTAGTLRRVARWRAQAARAAAGLVRRRPDWEYLAAFQRELFGGAVARPAFVAAGETAA